MIKRSLVTALVLAVVHFVYARTHAPVGGQHQWQDSVIRAQSFLFAEGECPPNVVVGSSLSARLQLQQCSEYVNLSYPGLSIFDGLEILARKPGLPRRLFIEMNIVGRDRSEDFLDKVISTPWFQMRRAVPSLREQYVPVSIVGARLMPWVHTALRKLKHATAGPVTPGGGTAFADMLEALRLENSTLHDESHLNHNLEELQRWVERFEQSGVEVVFFEMPMNPTVMDLAAPVAVRNGFLRCFPPARYHYIDPDREREYITTDGAHLSQKEAAMYTSFFLQSVLAIR